MHKMFGWAPGLGVRVLESTRVDSHLDHLGGHGGARRLPKLRWAFNPAGMSVITCPRKERA